MKLRALLLLTLLAFIALPSAAHAATAICNVPIKTGDGIVLRANLWLPSENPGRVPTVLTVTGYNKDATDPTGRS
jgi:predicted acyl esterase